MSASLLISMTTVVYWLLLLLVTVRILTKRRPVSGTMSWLLLVLLLPAVGIVLYFLFGELSLGKKREQRAREMVKPYLSTLSFMNDRMPPPLPGGEQALAVHQLLAKRLGLSALSYQHLELLHAPNDIFDAWLQDIASARRRIRMEFYIWFVGGRVGDIEQALIAASQRGVEVELIIDHAGSRAFFRSAQHAEMVAAGIEIIPALPVRIWRFAFRRLDLRIHRKLVIVDDQVAYTGSMNMADPDCFNKDAGFGPWIDVMLRIEGSAAQGLSKVFSWDWEVETGERRLPNLEEPVGVANEWLSIVPSGPGIGDDVIEQILLSSIYRSNHSIVICTPYFVPSESVFEALCQAAKRDVKIDIIVPKNNNSWLVKWASYSYYETLLQLGVCIHNFDGGLLHTKALLVDDELALMGSVNLDIRSLQLNFELSVALFSPQSCHIVRSLLESYLDKSEPVRLSVWLQRSPLERFLQRTMYFMSPLL